MNQLSCLQLQSSVETRNVSGLNHDASNSSFVGPTVNMVVSYDFFFKTYNASRPSLGQKM